SYFGGDSGGAPVGCTSTSATPTFKILHEYAYGVRNNSKYQGMSHSFLRVDIDISTGLPSASYDTADVVTSFEYDLLGRIKTVIPTGVASTAYTYNAATFQPLAAASVEANQISSTGNVHSRYEYDAVGRLTRELIDRPGMVA